MAAGIEVLLSELARYTETPSPKSFALCELFSFLLAILCISFPFLSALWSFNSLVMRIVKKGTVFMNSLLSSLLMFLLSFHAEFISGIHFAMLSVAW